MTIPANSDRWYNLEEELDQHLRGEGKSQIGTGNGDVVKEYIHYGSDNKYLSAEYESENKIYLYNWKTNTRFLLSNTVGKWTLNGKQFTTKQIVDEWRNS